MAKPKPMPVAIDCPASTTAPKIICMTKPMARPIEISRNAIKMPGAEKNSISGLMGNMGAISALNSAASTTRMRTLTVPAPNTGATISMADRRKKGHK